MERANISDQPGDRDVEMYGKHYRESWILHGMERWGRQPKTERRVIRAAIAAIVVIGTVMMGNVLSEALAQGAGRQPKAQYTGKGPDACLSCHSGAKITVIGETPHGEASNPHTPYAQQGCESCHGPGSFHVSRARGGQGSPPLYRFGHGTGGANQQFDVCISCHAETKGDRLGIGWVGSVHETSGMTCSTCHLVHSKENPLANVKQQQNLCARCHGTKNSKHDALISGGVPIESMKCSNCHAPHRLGLAASAPKR